MTNRVNVPEGMVAAVKNRYGSHGEWNVVERVADLEAALGWLEEILHERNVDFHRAILSGEQERFPGADEDLNIISRRVDFEYGVSFARNYIHNLFIAPEPDCLHRGEFKCEGCGASVSVGCKKAPEPEERDIFQSLKGRTFTQEEADMVYDYVQRSVHGGRCPCMRDKKDTLEPEVDIRTQVHRMFHKLWTASVGTEGYDKEHWNKMDGLLQNALYPPNKSAELY